MGYSTVELTQKFNLVGINFSTLDGSDTVNVKDLFSGTFTDGDQIQIRAGAGYDICVWDTDKWVNYGGTEETTRTVERGTGIWLVLNNATEANPVSVTMSGSVDLLTSKETALAQGYAIASAGLPMNLSVNSPKLIWTGLTNGDQLQIRAGAGYDICIWTDGVWVNYGGSEPSERTISADAAFWVVSATGNATVTVDPTK